MKEFLFCTLNFQGGGCPGGGCREKFPLNQNVHSVKMKNKPTEQTFPEVAWAEKGGSGDY